MPSFIIRTPHARRPYLEYSTIVDAPITWGMSLDELHQHIKDKYGSEGLRELPARLVRVEAKGTSAHDDASADDTIVCNRAGLRETELTMAQLVDFYCERRGSGEKPVGSERD